MAQQMYHLVDRSKIIPVDIFDTPEYPIDESDRLFKNAKGEIILPIHELFGDHNTSGDNEQAKQLDYFAMHSKRSYNSDETRDHICQYMNYFEKFYDTDHELLMIMYKIKIAMDSIKTYSEDNFMADINRYIIRNTNLTFKIRRMVDDNYSMSLSNNNNKTPNLQFTNRHAKVLYEMTILMNMYVPLATHFMYINFIKGTPEIQRFMLRLFDMCMIKYEEERGIYIWDKLYETATSVVNKSVNVDRQLWDKNLVRGVNPVTHVRESVIDAIIQITVKFRFNKNVLNFLYYSNRQCLRFRIREMSYEFSFSRLSESKKDSDYRSELDRYEAHLVKKDESIALQNKVAAEQTVQNIINRYGPITDEEVDFYRMRLTLDGQPLINHLQASLIGYAFYKDFGDPMNFMAIRNNTDYIKLIICAKRIYKNAGMVLLPYILSAKVLRTASRKIISKKDSMRYERSKIYEDIRNKYNNDERIMQKIWELIGTVASSVFEIIDYDNENHKPSDLDGKLVPIINDIVYEELLFFIITI